MGVCVCVCVTQYWHEGVHNPAAEVGISGSVLQWLIFLVAVSACCVSALTL